jgi:hypothetical protein
VTKVLPDTKGSSILFSKQLMACGMKVCWRDMTNKDGFLLYKQQYKPISKLSNTKLGLLLRSLFEYQIDGTIPTLPADCEMAYQFIKTQFDIDARKYEAFIELQREKGKKSAASRQGQPTAVNNGQPNQPVSTYKDTDTEKETVTETAPTPKPPFSFKPNTPTVEDFDKYLGLAEAVTAKHEGAR